MTEAEIAEMTAKYTLWGIIIGAVITGVIGVALLAWLTRRFNRSLANEQVRLLRQAMRNHLEGREDGEGTWVPQPRLSKWRLRSSKKVDGAATAELSRLHETEVQA